MTGNTHGGTPADLNSDGAAGHDDNAWDRLASSLAAYLATMVDPAEDDHLIIELAAADTSPGAGSPPYVQFAGFGDGRYLRAEVAGDAYLLPAYRLADEAATLLRRLGWEGNEPAGRPEERNWHIERSISDVAMVADQTVQVLRDCFRVAHPQLLTYQAWGPAAEGASVLELCATGDVPIEQSVAPSAQDGAAPARGAIALEPADRDELLDMVASVLRRTYGTEPEADEDGDFVLEHMGQPVWVRVHTEQPAVQIMARVAHDVHSRRATAVEIGLLNRDNLWVRWNLRRREVWQTAALPGLPFVPSHLEEMLRIFCHAMTTHRDDLAYRTGARVG